MLIVVVVIVTFRENYDCNLPEQTLPWRARAPYRSTAQTIGTGGFACAAEAARKERAGAMGVVAPPSSGSAWPIAAAVAAAGSRPRPLRVKKVPLVKIFPARVSRRTPTSPPLATATSTTTGVLSEKSRGHREGEKTPTKPLVPLTPTTPLGPTKSLAPTKPSVLTKPLTPTKPLAPIKPPTRSTTPTPAAVQACRCRGQSRGRRRGRGWATIF